MKTFVIFATFMSLAFASQELLLCMDERAADAGKESQWAADHEQTIQDCDSKQNIAANQDDQTCNVAEAKDAAAHAHQQEACIMVGFGWISSDGKVNVDKMFEDFNADQKFKDQVKGTMEACVKRVSGKESKAVKDMHAAFVEKCGESADQTPEDAEAVKQAMIAEMAYGAEAKCAMGEMFKACGIPPPQKA